MDLSLFLLIICRQPLYLATAPSRKKIILYTISGLLSLECLHVHKQINKLENIQILNDNDDSKVCSTKRSQNR